LARPVHQPVWPANRREPGLEYALWADAVLRHGLGCGERAVAPGQSITLSSHSLRAGYSIWPGWFASGTSDLYAYADSYNPSVVAGAVAESDEANNQFHLGGLVVTGSNPSQVRLQDVNDLPSRPIHRGK